MKKLTQFIGEFMENKKEINCWNIPTKVREKMVEDFAKGLYYAQNLPFFSYAFSYRTLPDSVKKDIKRIATAACNEYIDILREVGLIKEALNESSK